MTFIILCFAVFAMVAFSTSATTGLGLWLLRRPIESLAPVGQARLFFAAALLPCLAAITVLLAALAPSFGWVPDHCDILQDHSHPHLCFEHPMSSWPTMTIVVLAAAVAIRLGWAICTRTHAIILGRATAYRLEAAASEDTEQNLRVLPTDIPQAFVLGLFRPKLYISRALFSGEQSPHLDVVLAHERAHLDRCDPLRRFVAGFMLCFHLPGIAKWLDQKHAHAQEITADESASQTVGSRAAVASALVALAKAHLSTPNHVGAVAFSGSDVQDRVLLLLHAPRQRDLPSMSSLIAVASIALVVIALGADAIHHQVEHWLGVLGH